MVEEVEERICSMVEEEEEPINGEETTLPIIVIMPKVEPTTGNGAMTSGTMTMSLQVTNGLDQMSNKWWWIQRPTPS